MYCGDVIAAVAEQCGGFDTHHPTVHVSHVCQRYSNALLPHRRCTNHSRLFPTAEILPDVSQVSQ